MSRDAQQLARSLSPLLKLARQKLGLGGMIALLVAGLLYVAVVQPLLAKKLGIDLPTIADITESAPPATQPPATKPSRTSPPRAEGPRVDLGDLAGVLSEIGRDAYRSEAGLRYTRGSQHGTRLAHLAAHTRDEPDREGSHGVFDPGDLPTVIRLVDEAYEQALTGRKTRTEREGDQTVYTIDLGRRIGYVGGQSGARRNHPPVNHIRVVVQGDRFITAFPLRP